MWESRSISERRLIVFSLFGVIYLSTLFLGNLKDFSIDLFITIIKCPRLNLSSTSILLWWAWITSSWHQRHNDIADQVVGLLVQMALQPSIRSSGITPRSVGAVIICLNRQAVQTNLVVDHRSFWTESEPDRRDSDRRLLINYFFTTTAILILKIPCAFLFFYHHSFHLFWDSMGLKQKENQSKNNISFDWCYIDGSNIYGLFSLFRKILFERYFKQKSLEHNKRPFGVKILTHVCNIS